MGVPVGCKSKWAQLPPTSLPSSFLHCVFILRIPFFHLSVLFLHVPIEVFLICPVAQASPNVEGSRMRLQIEAHKPHI